MSEKKAKELRKQLAQEPKIVGKIEILVYETGHINVKNPPNNLTTALIVLSKAQSALINYFSQQDNRIVMPN